MDALTGAEDQLFVNGVPLADRLAELDPEVRGLVPAWLDWYDEGPLGRAEENHVRARSTPGPDPVVLPILLCPDDFDFSCTTVVVEVVLAGEEVHWRRFGLDRTPFVPGAPPPQYVGGRVDWLPASPRFVFARQAYLDCVTSFPLFVSRPLGRLRPPPDDTTTGG